MHCSGFADAHVCHHLKVELLTALIVPLAQRRVTYIIDKVESFKGHVISLESGKTLPADILVNARKESDMCRSTCSLILGMLLQ